MSQEIIYTSAQKGLRSGSFGFCTVCSTGGMEPNMADFLEGISAYPHPYKPPDPRTNQNPVNFSHIIWTIGGQRFHILSRVCDAGLDYTGRTNLLAHHVALTRREAESAAGGPAWVLSDDDLTVSKWDGQLRTLPGRFPRKDDIPLEVCRHWQQASGDAGHAGVLAESCLDKSGRPVTVIYKPETDVLALVREALSLLPVEKRWGVTFSTFYTKIYSSFECQWRFIFAGSPDAAAARKNPHSFVIDLAGPTPPKRASGGSLVEAARNGQFAARSTAAPLASPSGIYVPHASRTRPPNLPAIPPPNPLGEHDPRLLPPEILPAAEESPQTAIRNPFRGNSQKPSAMTLAVTCLASLCVSLLVILGIMLLRKPPENKILAQVPQNVLSVPTANPQPRINVHPVKESPAAPPTTGDMNPATVNAAATTPMEPSPATTTVPDPDKTVEPPPPTPKELPPPFSDIEMRNHVLKVPMLTRTGRVITTPQILCDIFVNSPQECEMSLDGVGAAFGEREIEFIFCEIVNTPNSREWIIKRKPQGSASRTATIATFVLRDKTLTFQWSSSALAAPRPDALRLCRLKLRAHESTTVCRLSEPEQLEPIVLTKPVTLYDLKKVIDPSKLADIDNLRLEVRPIGFPKKLTIQPAGAISPGKKQQLYLIEGNEDGLLVLCDLHFQFDRSDEQGRQIQVKCFYTYNMAKDKELSEAMDKARGSALSLSILNPRKTEYAAKAKVLKRKITESKNILSDAEKDLNPKIKTKQNVINDLRNVNQKDAIPAREMELAGLEAQLQRVKDSVATCEQNAEEHKRQVEYLDKTIDFATQIQRDARLEFRIFIAAGKDEVELYSTSGFHER